MSVGALRARTVGTPSNRSMPAATQLPPMMSCQVAKDGRPVRLRSCAVCLPRSALVAPNARRTFAARGSVLRDLERHSLAPLPYRARRAHCGTFTHYR